MQAPETSAMRYHLYDTKINTNKLAPGKISV